MHQRKNMTAQHQNGTTNSSPRSAVRRSGPSFLRFTASRTDFRRTVGGARSKERGQRSVVGGAGTDAKPDNTPLPGRETASPLFRRPSFSGGGTERCGRNARRRAGRRRPGNVRHGEGRADANTAQGPEKKASGPAALRTQSPARNRPKEADGPDAGKTPETESARTKPGAREKG